MCRPLDALGRHNYGGSDDIGLCRVLGNSVPNGRVEAKEMASVISGKMVSPAQISLLQRMALEDVVLKHVEGRWWSVKGEEIVGKEHPGTVEALYSRGLVFEAPQNGTTVLHTTQQVCRELRERT